MENKRIAVAVVQRGDGKVLIVQRRPIEKGTGSSLLQWSFPGGEVLPGDSPPDVARTYTSTETGYDVRIKELLHQRQHPEIPVYISYFIGELITPAKKVHNETIVAVSWVYPHALSRYFTTHFDETVHAYVMQAMSQYHHA